MAGADALTITPEWARNVICVEGRGRWTVDQMREHFALLAGLVTDLRSRNGMARVLVDLREMRGQSDEVAAVIRAETASIYMAQDGVALLVATALQRESMGGITSALNAAMFDDPFAALRWLNEG